MENLINSWNWFLSLNIYAQITIIVGILNIAIAGLKQLGLSGLADLCLKIENALLAMTSAAKTAFVASMSKPKVVQVDEGKKA